MAFNESPLSMRNLRTVLPNILSMVCCDVYVLFDFIVNLFQKITRSGCVSVRHEILVIRHYLH